jgi:hypothetical protein
VLDIVNGQLTTASPMGQVGQEWKVVGFGDFSGNANETDMMMRNVNTGTFELYNISNNAIAGANAIGNVGVEWQVAGFGPFNGVGSADMVLRNINTGAFEVYDIAKSKLTTAASLGQVGLEWQLGGFAVDPPTGSMAVSSSQVATDATTSQLVQARAGFSSGGAALDQGPISQATQDGTPQPSLFAVPSLPQAA